MLLLDYILTTALAFLLGIVDASFGMGYGTLLTPMLLMLGLAPLNVVPAVLISQLAGDFLAALFHHRFKNVDLSIESSHLKIALALASLSLLGSFVAVLVAVNLPAYYLSLYIGVAVTISGLIILAVRRKNYAFSWRRLFCFGSWAAFNKGISGGGYGPIVVVGQLLTGVEAKSAIGITALSEGITCVFAAIMYLSVPGNIDLLLLISLTIGIIISTPLAAFVVRKLKSTNLRLIVGVLTLSLGILTTMRTVYF